MIKLTLPVYFNTGSKTVLVGMNWSRNAHYHILNKVKKSYHEMVATRLSEFEKIDSKFTIKYTYFYKNSASDGGNVIAQIEKYLLDGMVSIGLVENDNVKYHIGSSWKVGEKDTAFPRVEIEIYGVNE